jgi:hypothetical protein
MILLVLSIIGVLFFVPFLPLGIQAVGNTTLSSSTSSMDEGTGFLDDFGKDTVSVISAAGSAATAFALYFVWKQARIAQNEVTTTLRPWISSSNATFEKPDKVIVALKNYGRLPAKVFSPSRYLIESHEIKVKDLQHQGKGDTVFLLSPDAERKHIINFVGDNSKITSGKTWFLGFVFYYSYANDLEGKYGIILRWRHDRERALDVIDEFAE